MCGIVGYVGDKQAQDVVDRGAAPAGVPRLRLGRRRARRRRRASPGRKKAGKLANLEKALAEAPLPESTTGIGHTRWATHGAPNDANAHPHLGNARPGRARAQRHHRELRRAPGRGRGRRRRAALRDRHRDRRPPAGVRRWPAAATSPTRCGAVCARLEGAFTLVAVDAEDPSRVVAARRNSPLVVGIGEGENFIGSDVAAFIEHTREALELGQDQIVTITRDGVDGHRLRRHARRGQPLPRRLGPLRRREGRLRLVHAQGDLRAAARDRRRAARPARRARAAPARRGADLRRTSSARSTRSSSSPAGRRSTPGWWPSTRSSTGPASRARSSSPTSSATATRSSPGRRWWSRSASPARPPTR